MNATFHKLGIAFFLTISSVGAIAQTAVDSCSNFENSIVNFKIDEQRKSLTEQIKGAVLGISMDGVDRKNMHFLSAAAKKWSNLDCVDARGFPRLTSLTMGIEDAFTNPSAFTKSLNWDASYKIVEKFKLEAKDEALSTIIESIYWRNYAWNARGTGMANSVTPEGWALFEERIKRAESILTEHKESASTIPIFYTEMVTVQVALGHSQDERYSIFLEGAKRYPQFRNLSRVMLYYSGPKWGGSWAKSDAVIEWSTKNSMTEMGQITYAFLYNSIRSNIPSGKTIYNVTAAKWPRIRQGFEDHLRRYPNSAIYDAISANACEADDKVTYLKYRKKIDKNNENLTEWTDSYPRELCDLQYGFKG